MVEVLLTLQVLVGVGLGLTFLLAVFRDLRRR